MTVLRTILVLTIALFQATPAREVLIKKASGGEEVNYYGHTKPNDRKTFVTCHGGEILIQPGRTKPETHDCSDPAIGPLSGIVKSVDAGTRILIVNDGHGSDVTFRLSDEEIRSVLGVPVPIGRNVSIRVNADGGRSIEIVQ